MAFDHLSIMMGISIPDKTVFILLKRVPESNSATPVEGVSLSNRIHADVLAFIFRALIQWIKLIKMAFVWWIWHRFGGIFSKCLIYSIALMDLGETCYLKGHNMAVGAVATLLWMWHHAMLLWRYAVWISIVTIHSAWMQMSIVSKIWSLKGTTNQE